jgi:hypothetical protein
MRVKDFSVRLELNAILNDFLIWVDAKYREWDDELVVTSGSEHTARHSFTSLHYAGCAVDVRLWNEIEHGRGKVPSPEEQVAALKIEAATYCSIHKIPPNWIEVILEGTHIHIEYQPKRSI